MKHSSNTIAQLLLYNQQLLQQAQGLLHAVQAHAPQSPRYAQAIGPHLRHVVEHYEALFQALDSALEEEGQSTCIFYDARKRDRDMEQSIGVAQARIAKVMQRLHLTAHNIQAQLLQLPHGLDVELQTGLEGEGVVRTPSSLARELMFLASHTIHHYALLQHYCREIGVDLGHDFGKAPSTLAFEKTAIVA